MDFYSSYKDSGVEWIGEIPNHWDRIKLGWISKKIGDGLHSTPKYVDSSDYYFINGNNLVNGKIKIFESTKSVSEEEYNKHFIPLDEKTILLSINGTIGNLSFYNNEKVILGKSSCYINLNKDINQHFIYYVLRCKSIVNYFTFELTGTTIFNLSLNSVKNTPIVFPPDEEQTQIVSFLDTKTQKIDELIENTQQKIKLLKEKRTSLINHCVTKGLNPDVEMKDSGVEWIGEISENFNVVQLKFITHIMRGKFSHRPRNDERFYGGEYPFIQTGDIVSSGKYLTNYKQTLNERGYSVSKEFPLDTLVMTISGNIGDVSILKIRSCFPDSIIGFFPKNQTSETFLYYLFLSMKDEFYKNSTVSTQMNLNVERVGSIRVPLPSKKEQTQIVEYLDEQTQKINFTIEKETQRIELLKEYRQSLISEVVTGKIDVRDWKE